MDNPISESVRKDISLNFSAEFAIALHEVKGWPLYGLTGNGQDWVYLAVKTPDGNILDINDYSMDGQHIIDDDELYALIPAKDFIDDGNAWFIPVPYDEACEYAETDNVDYPQDELTSYAKRIIAWYNS